LTLWRGKFLTRVLMPTTFGCLISLASLAGDSTDATKQKRPMPANEPMPTKMAKPGMKTGDVGKAAEKMDQRMKPMLDKEGKSMPGK